MIKSLIALIIITLIELITFHYYIKYLKQKKYTQSVRELGPKSHFKKTGTPTAGGIIIVLFFIIDYVVLKILNNYLFNLSDLIIILTAILFSVLGLLDDLKIIKQNKNDGLKPSIKLIIETLFVILIYFILIQNNYNHSLKIFNYELNLGIFSIFFILFYVIAWSNSFNITDGLDGLASSLSLCILLGMFIIGKYEKNQVLVLSSICLFSTMIAFLTFNFHPALVFMGNVGSHALGAIIAVCAIISRKEITFAVMGLVFVFETISVILQVLYYKKTKGKRLFKMAPFHHHLELSGYNENSISLILVLISFLLMILGIILWGI